VDGSYENCPGKDTFAESAQLPLEDEQLEDMIPIYAAPAISNDLDDGTDDPKSYTAATESPLA